MQAEMEARSYIEPSRSGKYRRQSLITFDLECSQDRRILIGTQFPEVMEGPSLVLQMVEGLGYSNIDIELVEIGRGPAAH